MGIQHSFDIYAKLYMSTHHFEFSVSFFFYVLVACSVLWCVVYVILRCGKLSVRLSVCPSVPAFASTFHHRLPWYFIRWLETLTACGSQISKVIWQISRSHRPKKQVKRVKFRVFGYFLENAWGNGLKYHMLLYPDHLILFWSRSADFTNFGGILTQWNISNVWFPYLMENAWQ